jgi:hypothetical protein
MKYPKVIVTFYALSEIIVKVSELFGSFFFISFSRMILAHKTKLWIIKIRNSFKTNIPV